MGYCIQTHGLVKRYGDTIAVKNLSLNVQKGDIYGIIGKNGAGKTTLMKMILGLTRANEGTVTLFGSDRLNETRRRIGSLIEAPALYRNRTALENMRRFALLSGTSEKRIRELLELVGLKEAMKKKVGGFSLGMRQRLGIAIALLGDPELLILDEPINGLDPAGIKQIRDMLQELNNQGVTLMISSHLLDELGKLATRYGIIADGELVEEISAQELKDRCRTSLKLVTDDGQKALAALQAEMPQLQIEVSGNDLNIYTETDSSEVNRILVSAGVRVYEMRDDGIGFEDFFIERLGK